MVVTSMLWFLVLSGSSAAWKLTPAPLSAGASMKPPLLPGDGGRLSRRAPEITAQRILPFRHLDLIGVQAVS